ncbi:SMP-30/gluconolactonase/LRE family protein [Dactylosporangium salmoneum]|uniref:SMP-30/Gluconolactonase/LRE-like region domain-containing protein n=1 Tax=Dactylosporangium salmoneum TaxID=53361 RepID=A0ABP5UUB6_9ACTN
MTARFTARAASADGYFLGEGPVWDPDRQRLLWVDIVPGRVFAGRLQPDDTITVAESWSFGATVGAVAVSATGELLVAERETVTHGGRTVARVLPEGGPSRLNDGAVDPAGRFLVGSLRQHEGPGGHEVLVRLDGGAVTTLDDDLTLSNGLAWSPDGRELYSIDTIPGTVWARGYDPHTGATGPRRELFTVTDGFPDGMCTDADGHLWIAVWGGGRVECRHRDGTLLAVVEVDAPHTSSVTFAGPGLDVLVITTARQDLSPDDLAAHPDSGRLFTARVGVTGPAAPYWDPAL